MAVFEIGCATVGGDADDGVGRVGWCERFFPRSCQSEGGLISFDEVEG
jgi:hypothetical protein